MLSVADVVLAPLVQDIGTSLFLHDYVVAPFYFAPMLQPLLIYACIQFHFFLSEFELQT